MSECAQSLSVCRAKRSWFTNFKLEKEKEEVSPSTGYWSQWLLTLLQVAVVFRERSLVELKASLKRAFSVSRTLMMS